MYQWRKGIASWTVGNKLYISVPFTWLMNEAEKMANLHKGPVEIGGPGTMNKTECPGFEPILYHNPNATFTTRGCPNKCQFCAVPKLEGDFREIENFRPAPLICDNNLLAASRKHIGKVVDCLKVFPLVDFNQGLEARRFTSEIADLLGNLKCKVRFAFDHINYESVVADAVKLCRQRTTKNIGIYVLIGFNDTPEDAKYRLDLVKSWGIDPNPMRFQPLNAKKKNEYIGPGWTSLELFKMQEYYSQLRFLRAVPYDEFRVRESVSDEQIVLF